jgi:hypothetical protein
MPDTVRAVTTLLTALFQDGQAAGSITAQDMRDLIVTMAAMAGYGATVSTVSAAGTSQGTATLLTTYNNIATTVASGTGVQIDSTQLVIHRVVNRGANPLLVYPPSGVQFETQSANAPITLPVGSTVEMVITSLTQAYIVGGHGAPQILMPTDPSALGSGNLWRNGNVVSIV